MAVILRFLEGPTAGQRLEFGDHHARIVVGRDPAVCDVVFPGDDRRVGRQHFVLEYQGDHYRLNLDGVHRVLVDDQPVEDGHAVRGNCTLRVSSTGPRLALELVVAQMTLPDPGPPPRPRAAPPTPAVRVPDVARRPANLGRGGGGYTAMLQRLDAKVSRSRRIAGLSALLALVGGGAVAWMVLHPPPEPPAPIVVAPPAPPPAPPPKPTMQKVLQGVPPSVYLVVLRDAEGRESAQATAWVVGDALLATNAHVANLYLERADGVTVLVRSTDAAPVDHVVTGAQLHPGYAAFAALWAEYLPAREATGGRWEAMNRIPACDVATLSVAPGAPLGPPLRLADAAAVEALGSGESVGFVGFPMENLAMGGVNVANPTPTTQIGTLTAVTDFFLGRQVAADRQLVQHSLPAAGGASGSPILDGEGRVVAVLSGGNVVMSERGRIATGAGVNFAQRVDLLRELLDGTADTVQVERTERWRAAIRQFQSLRDHIVGILVTDWLGQLGAGDGEEAYAEVSAVTAEHVKDQWYQAVVELTVPPEGRFLLTGIGTPGQEIDVFLSTRRHDTFEALLQSGDVVARETDTGWASTVTFEREGGAGVLTVYAYVISDAKDLPVRLQLHRAR